MRITGLVGRFQFLSGSRNPDRRIESAADDGRLLRRLLLGGLLLSWLLLNRHLLNRLRLSRLLQSELLLSRFLLRGLIRL